MRLRPLDLTAIAIGGVVGAAVRWGVSRLFHDASTSDWFRYAPNSAVTLDTGFPWATLVVNVVGCLILGWVATRLVRETDDARQRMLAAAGTGFCGSLTTFSTFAVEIAQRLAWMGTSDAATNGLLYLVVSLAAGALAFATGRRAAP